MKLSIEVLAVLLLAVPVALLIIFDAPGLGIILAIALVTAGFMARERKADASFKVHRMQDKEATFKRAA